MNIQYHQINVGDLDRELEKINSLTGRRNKILIGLEITVPEISRKMTFNIDPQHGISGGKESDITCLEKFRKILPDIYKMNGKEVHMFFLKPDLDSVSAAAILDIYLDNPSWMFQEEISERIDAIARYDRHGRRPHCFQNAVKIPKGLFMYVGGWKNGIEDKINLTKRWILDGTFKDINKFNRIADEKFKLSLTNLKVEIIIPKTVVFIRSIGRGACGFGYKYAPIVVALNPSYRFGIDDRRTYGKKWIIAQKNESFLDMEDVLRTLSEKEEGWGGSPSIIGSSQIYPSKLSKDDVVETVIQKILVH